MRYFIQWLGIILSAAYEAISLIQTAISGVPTESVLHRWIFVAVFFVFLGFTAWAIIDRDYQIKAQQKKLNDPLIQDRQEVHIYKIEELIKKWAFSLQIPTLSEVLPGTRSDAEAIKNDPSYGYLKEHLPFDELWQLFSEWDNKAIEYLSNSKKLNAEIQSAWKVDGTSIINKYFSIPIFEAIEGRELDFSIVAGTGHELIEIRHQTLNVNGRDVVRGIEFSNNNTYQDIKREKCDGLILKDEYTKLAIKYVNSMTATEIQRLYSELENLRIRIQSSLHLYLERADYVNNHCSVCPIEQKVKYKEV
jgi:hypothetical protein